MSAPTALTALGARGRLGQAALAFVLASTTTGCVRRYMTVDYDLPTARLRSAVSLARVADEAPSVTAPLHVIVYVSPPKDSVIVLVLRSPMQITDIGDAYERARGSSRTVAAVKSALTSAAEQQRRAPAPNGLTSKNDDVAAPLLTLRDQRDSVVPIDSIQPCEYSKAGVCKPKLHAGSVLFALPRADTTVHLLVYLPIDRRLERSQYHVDLQWVAIPTSVEMRLPAIAFTNVDLPLANAAILEAIDKEHAERATAHELRADARFSRVNYYAVPFIAIGAIGLVLLTANSR